MSRSADAAGQGWALHLGDAIEVLRQLDDQSVDLIVTDPPYSSERWVHHAATRLSQPRLPIEHHLDRVVRRPRRHQHQLQLERSA